MNLTLAPTSSSLPELRRAVARILGEADGDLVADVLLALDEAVSNAVRHGSRGGEPVDIVMAWAGGDARLLDASRREALGVVVAAMGRGNVPPAMVGWQPGCARTA